MERLSFHINSCALSASSECITELLTTEELWYELGYGRLEVGLCSRASEWNTEQDCTPEDLLAPTPVSEAVFVSLFGRGFIGTVRKGSLLCDFIFLSISEVIVARRTARTESDMGENLGLWPILLPLVSTSELCLGSSSWKEGLGVTGVTIEGVSVHCGVLYLYIR